MSSKREELIKSALMDKISDGFNMYTADDILTVADISEAEMQDFQYKIQADVIRLAGKKKQ